MRSPVISILTAGALVLVPSFGWAQGDTLSRADRARIVQDFEQSNQAFLASITGLTPAQWNFKPAPGRWSIAEVAEHLTLVESGLGGMVQQGGLQPISAFSPDSAATLEAGVRGLYGNRERRMSSPEGFAPAGKWATQAELVSAYEDARRSNLQYLRTTRDPIRARGLAHPGVGGTIDGAHWMVAIAVHMNRHLQQIEEVKRAEGYPR